MGSLGRSWGAFGRSWGALGRSWAALGRLLGVCWAPQRPLRGPGGAPERIQDGPKVPAKRPQEQAPGRQLAPPRRDGKTSARSAHGKTSARSARETASPETPETREIYHETTTPRYRERLIFTATPPDHGKRERFTTRPPDHGHRDRCTFSAGAPDHGKRASFTVGPPDKRGNLGGQPLHQLLFQTPLSVFSLGRFRARRGASWGSFLGFFRPFSGPARQTAKFTIFDDSTALFADF